MEFWTNVPLFGPGIDGALIADYVEAADELGFAAVGAPDHVIVSADHEPAGYRTVLESIVALSYAAARTTRIRIGTSIMAVPLRGAVLLAKQLATLDVVSDGRVFAGLGLGNFPAEFALVGADFHTRGAYLDETIRLMRHLWSGDDSPFVGRFNHLENYSFAPLPPQGADIPILIGGRSDAALRRAATVGDAWQSSDQTPEQFRPMAETVKRLAGEQGRHVTVGTEVRYGTDWGARLSGDNPDELRAAVAAWRDAGCEHLSVGFRQLDMIVPHMELFAREVFPAFEGDA
jgi:probable F420-dependent oxidoreductase